MSPLASFRDKTGADLESAAFDRLSKVLLSPAAGPAADTVLSSSGSSGSSASSPHSSSGAASNTPPSEFDWLADRAEADKLTDLLASIGSDLESSAAAAAGVGVGIEGHWADGFQFHGFEHPVQTKLAKERAASHSTPAGTATGGERRASGSLYPSLTAFTSAGTTAATSSFATTQQAPVQVRSSRPLAPAQIAPYEPHRSTIHHQALLQRAPPISSVRGTSTVESGMVGEKGEDGAEGKYGESIRSTSVKLPPLAAGSSEPSDETTATTTTVTTAASTTGGTTLPSFKSLFSEIPPTTASTATGVGAKRPSYPSLVDFKSPTPPYRPWSTGTSSRSEAYRPVTAESLSGRVDHLGLSSSSESGLDEEEDELEQDPEDDEEGRHKRTRLGERGGEGEEERQVARNRLAVVHALIVKVNEVHRALAARKAGQRSAFSSDQVRTEVQVGEGGDQEGKVEVRREGGEVGEEGEGEVEMAGSNTPVGQRSGSPMNEDD